MRDFNASLEKSFFDLFHDFFDLEKDAGKQHDCHNYTLDRMTPLAACADFPEKTLKVIHIAGTKGKGSTSYFIAALLNAAGHHCGIFTSPHLSTVRERFQIDGHFVDYPTLIAAGERLCRCVKAAGLHPSLFELFTVLALRIFADAGVEYAVMETGIGGRLDATNYIPRKEVAVITPLSYDHMALLGDTIEAIATEKAGILRPGTPVVLSKQPFAAGEKTIRECAGKLDAPVIPAEISPELSAAFLPAETPAFLKENFATAWTAVHGVLKFTPDPAAFISPQLRARFEQICDDPVVILDAAHNGDSARQLAEAVHHRFGTQEITCVLGCVPGKDIHGIVRELSALNARFILTNPDTPRGSALPQLKEYVQEAGLPVMAVIDHLACRQQLPADEPLLFTGSFFTALIGEKLFN